MVQFLHVRKEQGAGISGSWSSCHAEISCCASGEAGAASGGEDHKLCPKIFVDTQTSYRISLCSDRHSVRGLVLTLPVGLLQEASSNHELCDDRCQTRHGCSELLSRSHFYIAGGCGGVADDRSHCRRYTMFWGSSRQVVRFCTNVCLSGRGMGDCNISARCPGRSRNFCRP